MSRIGLKPIPIPQGVTVKHEDNGLVSVKGPKGELSRIIGQEILAHVEDRI